MPSFGRGRHCSGRLSHAAVIDVLDVSRLVDCDSVKASARDITPEAAAE